MKSKILAGLVAASVLVGAKAIARDTKKSVSVNLDGYGNITNSYHKKYECFGVRVKDNEPVTLTVELGEPSYIGNAPTDTQARYLHVRSTISESVGSVNPIISKNRATVRVIFDGPSYAQVTLSNSKGGFLWLAPRIVGFPSSISSANAFLSFRIDPLSGDALGESSVISSDEFGVNEVASVYCK